VLINVYVDWFNMFKSMFTHYWFCHKV